MRLILIGTEYTGKSTLCQGLMDWGHANGIHHHLDDHFSIPDCQMLKSEEDQKIMTGLPDILKERFQRFQIAYHVRLINKYEHILLGGAPPSIAILTRGQSHLVGKAAILQNHFSPAT